jgi:CheY-like chemotaxis protein
MTSRRILVIEDDQAIRDMLQLTLQMEGYDVQTAGDGREALELLRKGPLPGMILLDLMMPGMNGFEFAAQARMDADLSRIPIVVLTAFPERAEGIPNARRVLAKPVEFEQLFGVLREFCG